MLIPQVVAAEEPTAPATLANPASQARATVLQETPDFKPSREAAGEIQAVLTHPVQKLVADTEVADTVHVNLPQQPLRGDPGDREPFGFSSFQRMFPDHGCR